jgi:hypothetical protein
MPKIAVKHQIRLSQQELKVLRHDRVVMENQAGEGGGQHLLKDIWDSTTDTIEEQGELQTIIQKLISEFKKVCPKIVINNYRVEHRVYLFDYQSQPFIGKVHDDSCEISAVYYYRIDSGIVGGDVIFYKEDSAELSIIDQYTPKVNDLLILDGIHSVSKLLCTSHQLKTRGIVILQINSEDV